MQRIRGQFVALAKPAYADPDDPTVSPNLGYFNKDPGQANTPLNQDWANMVQEELCGAVVALGGTLDGEDDTQLATLFQQGTFAPVLADETSITYTVQTGFYRRMGSWVHAYFSIAWENADDTKNTDPVVIVPPFDLLDATEWVGALAYDESDFGTGGANVTTAALRLSSALGGVQVRGRQTTMNSSISILAYGDDDARHVIGSISYRTDGVYLY
jgi:hypothetical protein